MKGEHEEINDKNVSWAKDNSSNFVYLSSNEKERERNVLHVANGRTYMLENRATGPILHSC